MKSQSPHHHHDDIARRLKRANGHLLSIIEMIESERSCVDIAQQLHAVEKAVAQAKRTLIQDHIDHCLEATMGNGKAKSAASTLGEFKAISKYL
jgi:uncharacterized protein